MKIKLPNFDKIFNPEKYDSEPKVEKSKKQNTFCKGIVKGVKEKMENIRTFTQDEDKVILEYLDKQIAYSEKKVEELQEQIAKYPDDEYSKKDLQNNFYLRNALLAMKRRIQFKN